MEKAKLEFILGRPGSGKTETIFSRAAALKESGAEGGIFVIVPEQATFETEKRLSERLKGGLFGVTVASWSGLSRKMLDSLGDRRAFLSPQGRVMLLRRCADAVAKDLTVFKRSSAFAGFPKEMDDLISKFKRCGMDPDQLAEAAEGLGEGSPLRDKLLDIRVIFAELARRCADRYIDPEDMMNELAARLGETALSGAHVFIDGGDTLHEQAYPIFRALLRYAAGVTVALDYDAASRDSALYFPSVRILERLCDIAREEGCAYSVTETGERRRPGTPAMLHLGRELFAVPQRAYKGEAEGLELTVCRSRLDEVTECAETIRRAAEGGMRYRDMSVLVSDLASYAPTVARVFSFYGIPYFTDVKRSLLTHPVAQLVIDALRAVESGFEPSYVVSVLRSGFIDIPPEASERFENFIIEKGCFGSRLVSPFEGEEEDFEPARAAVMLPLLRFKEALTEGGCESRARAIHSLLEELDVYSKQQSLCEELREAGLYREEEENAQVVNTVLEVLDQLFVIMGGERIGLKRFISVVKEGLGAYEVGVIPTTADQVLVGSMDRTRSKEVKLLCVLGMTDGLFPRVRKDDRVIDDGDLRILKAHGVELWQSSRSLAEGDLMTVASALSKATERIVFSYPATVPGSAEEASALPCRLVGVIRELFPGMKINDLTAEDGSRSSEPLAFASLGRRLRRMLDTGERDPEAARLWAYFSQEPKYKDDAALITRSCFGEEELPPFGTELAKRLYGASLYGSASRLEDFNKCPFLHYARYGLEARPRRERSMQATDKGTFRHAALEAYVRYVMDNGLDWREIDDEKTFKILEEILPKVMADKKNGALYDTARQRAELWELIESVRFTCCAITRHIAAGRFRPFGCEVSFGRADSIFPALRIDASNGASFRISGIIDRIDSFTDSEGRRLDRVIDYKSGGKDFRFEYLNAGLQLQLPLYAAAIEAAETVGMFYMPVTDVPPGSDEEGGQVKEMTDELIKRFRLNGLCLKDPEVIEATEEFEKSSSVMKLKRGKDGELTGSGLVDRDELRFVMDTARSRAARTLESIYEGEAAARPYRSSVRKSEHACAWCDYRDVCRFDPDLSKTGYRNVAPMSADMFFGRDGE